MYKKINNKIMTKGNKKYFNPPTDENNNPYWIPVVVKDKSYLLGFIEAFRIIHELSNPHKIELELTLSSDRFNDILMDGSRIQNLTREQLKDKIRNIMFPETTPEDHTENSQEILKEYLLNVSCPKCGMFYGFKTEEEIPKTDFKCNICNRYVLMYTNKNDDYFDFYGQQGDIEEIVAELNNENID